MPVHAFLLPTPTIADLFVVVDVLRFTTSAAYALAHGARSIVPCESLDQARAMKQRFPDLLLAGERNAVRPEAFDFGNSPLEFTPEAVQGRDLAWSTTNGTRAIATCLTAPPPVPRPHTRPPSQNLHPRRPSPNSCDLILASPVNLRAVASLLEPLLLEGAVVAIACSGREGGFALEDAACAGALVRRLRTALGGSLTMDHGARACVCIDEAYGEDFARLFRDAQHGRFLRDHGFGADLVACAQIDAVPVVPRWRDGRVVAG